MKSPNTIATLFAIIGTSTSFSFNSNYGRHSHANTVSYNSLRDMAAYPETFHRRGGGAGGGSFDDGNWRTNNGYSQGPGGYGDMATNPYYDEGWSQSTRSPRMMMMGGGPRRGPMMGGPRSADGFDPYGPYSPAMGVSRSDRRMDQGDLFMNSDAMGMRSDRTMRGFTYSGRTREYDFDPGMMFEDHEFGHPGMMGGMMEGGEPPMGMMGGGGMGRMGP